MRWLFFSALILILACEGPTGPQGPPGPPGETDTLYVYHTDPVDFNDRKIVWLYPEDVIYRDSVDFDGDILVFNYFDINIDEYYDRRATDISAWACNERLDPQCRWLKLAAVTSSSPNIYYKKIAIKIWQPDEWRFAYFYWDVEL